MQLLDSLDGQPEMPVVVTEEITDEPAATALSEALDSWLNATAIGPASQTDETFDTTANLAASHLGVSDPEENWHGDVALLAYALALARLDTDAVVITDDKPLRKTCKTLSIPVSGRIGVLIRAVERGEIDAEAAKKALYAMDEVGARLSASLVRRAERMIDAAAENVV